MASDPDPFKDIPGTVLFDATQARLGYQLGPLQIWLDLTKLRSQIVGTWVKHSLAEGRRLLNQRLRAEFVAGAEEDSHHGSGVA